ncbi:hypothetical protein ACFL5O_01940, partial [Myxococcota bacterium]
AAPLSVSAKPSDLQHGLFYAAAAALHLGLPWLVLAPRAWFHLPGHHRAVLAACAAHVIGVVLAGGDWMALFRLMVPVTPGLVLVGAALLERSAPWASWLRILTATSISLRLMAVQGPQARLVNEQRLAVIHALAPSLRSARRVAALDIGWVGAATEAHVVDLAGITDPTVAMWPGGHTSKQLPAGFLRARRVDHLVPQPPWTQSAFRAQVEALVFRQAQETGFELVAWSRLGQGGHYVVLRLKDERRT